MLGPSPLVPPWFEVPLRVETEEFVLIPLTWDGFHHDFESYMSSVEHLQATFDLDAVNPFVVDGARWPANTSLELAFIDAAWQQFESEVIRSSFCYCVKDVQESRQLGCGYIFHSEKSGCEVECHTWVRADMLERGFDEKFYSWFRNWVDHDWPFSAMTVVWPGRDISWEEWNAMPNERQWHG